MTDQVQSTPVIDMDALNKEVASMSSDQLAAELLKIRVRQKKQQAKMQGSSSQKAYQQRQKALRKLLKEKAVSLGIYDKINEQAAEQAKQELAAQAANVTPGTDDEEVEDAVEA